LLNTSEDPDHARQFGSICNSVLMLSFMHVFHSVATFVLLKYVWDVLVFKLLLKVHSVIRWQGTIHAADIRGFRGFLNILLKDSDRLTFIVLRLGVTLSINMISSFGTLFFFSVFKACWRFHTNAVVVCSESELDKRFLDSHEVDLIFADLDQAIIALTECWLVQSCSRNFFMEWLTFQYEGQERFKHVITHVLIFDFIGLPVTLDVSASVFASLFLKSQWKSEKHITFQHSSYSVSPERSFPHGVPHQI